MPALLTADVSPAERHARRSPRDWAVDVAAFLIAIVFGILGFVEVVQVDGFTWLRIVDLAVGASACVALWWRRRWPVHLAVIMTVAGLFSPATSGALVVMIFTVAVHRRFPVVAGIAAANILGAALYFRIYPSPDMSWPASMVFIALFTVAIVAWGMFVRARRQLVISLRERARQAESEAHLRVEQARHRERERIAREMHDVLAHRLSLLSVHANALEYRPDAPPEDLARVSGVIRESAHQALQDLREVIGVLRTPAQRADGAGQPALEELTSLVTESTQAGMDVTVVDTRTDEGDPPPLVDRCAYRLIQEGLTNARKHAPGTAVTISLGGGPGEGLRVSVHNAPLRRHVADGSIPGAGTGLVGLRERVDLAGGLLSHRSLPDGGFTLSAELPWPR
ncbi:sensor histidine kinase [Phytoactinopolyspora alkaliphila]|uniref:histidine kinase n=1 Tax=Phytoactinopolyspora alkaliphila TaxID=1783498 RepID=A0A6N9YRG7_9ACTN|nr:sensor histidine kinase [Phytoactinopolyspora alkaliphila]